MNEAVRLLTIFLLLPIFSFSQNCTLSVSGFVKDLDTGEPLLAANIYIEDISKGVTSDSNGFFDIKNVCAGDYHILISHLGCETQRVFIQLNKDTSLIISMNHSAHVLNGLVVSSNITPNSTQNTRAINEQNISDNLDKNLSNLLESLSGVSTLKNGSGISKPIIHGLYGNRVTILNNGIAQSGQQWGNDHSPEIDPLVANQIKVIKGVSTLEYPGSNLGGLVLVQPKKITKEEHLHGKASYFFESNGRGHGLNLQLQQANSNLAWKVNGTLKKSGDKNTPDYFLRNTGNQEANIAIQLEKSFSEKFHTNLYLSSFNTILGVLRGSHIGNLTDLEAAFSREAPFFTIDTFKYTIDAPKQEVHHHLIKIQSKYFVQDEKWWEFTLAGQLNNRKEFDVRRSGRTDIPALSLLQYTAFAEAKFQQRFNNDIQLKTGFQSNFIHNTNSPETGILPLIPDYLALENGVFVVLTKDFEKLFLEWGCRYDNIYQHAATISRTIPRTIIRYNNYFHNFSTSGGLTYQLAENYQINYNIGLATRNPAINELYSFGLHQGVSGIEEGNIDLSSEQSLKSTFSLQGKIKEKLSFETLFYYQNINNYIFLNPQEEFQLTIRGAFPLFRYEQTDARIYGLDFTSLYEISPAFNVKIVYSYIKGQDLTNDVPLIYMPANNISGSLHYEVAHSISIGKRELENFSFELTNKYVFKQNNILPEQDFALAPDAYNLLGLQMATEIQLNETRLRIFSKVDNLLNVAYRDYLNRLRYFSDDLGINVVIGLSLKF